jgi:P4 family phage/plasmid primase-like protien
MENLHIVQNYLSQYRQKEQNTPYNVQGLNGSDGGWAKGRFMIPDDEYETFLDNIASFVFDKKVRLGLVERRLVEDQDGTDLTPIKIDLDFRFPLRSPFLDDLGSPIRKTTPEMLIAFCKLYWKELTCLIDTTQLTTEKGKVSFYLLQKPYPEIDKESKEERIKDGLHIICKDIQTIPVAQMYIREKVVKKMGEVFDPEIFTSKTTFSEMMDKKVIAQTGWILHGNRKEGKLDYRVFAVVVFDPLNPDAEPEIHRRTDLTDRELIKILSIRYNINGSNIIIRPEMTEIFNAFIKNEYKKSISTPNKQIISKDTARLLGIYGDGDGDRGEAIDDYSVADATAAGNPRFDADSGAGTGAGVAPGSRGIRMTPSKMNLLRDVNWLMDMLSAERATNYDTWIQVCFVLRDIERKHHLPSITDSREEVPEVMKDGESVFINRGLYNAFVGFSKKSPRYTEGQEDAHDWYSKFWVRTTRAENQSGKTIRSLYYWARLDSPERYAKFIENNVNQLMKKAVHGGGTHVDLATIVKAMYDGDFVCADIKHKIWYEFRRTEHRWVPIDSATTLRGKLIQELRPKFRLMLGEYQRELATRDQDGEASVGSGRGSDESTKGMLKIIASLGTTKYLNDLISECQHTFYNSEFEAKLDTNPFLFGFRNGILDLTTGELRDGNPEDLVSLSTGYDFTEWDEEHPKIQKMMSILNQIFVDPELREYVIAIIASALRGENFRQEVYFLNGVGANGKSLITKYSGKSFGDYATKLNIAVLMEKRPNAQAASPEFACLKGKRFIHMEEPEEEKGSHINHTLLKELTGGTEIKARPMYRDVMTFPAMFKMFLSCNKFPKIDPDPATWRRIRAIPHYSRFLKRKDDITDPVYEFVRDEGLMSDANVNSLAPYWMAILVKYYRMYWVEHEMADGTLRPERELETPACVREFSDRKQKESDELSDMFTQWFRMIPAHEIRLMSEVEKRSRCLTILDIKNYLREKTTGWDLDMSIMSKLKNQTELSSYLQNILHVGTDTIRGNSGLYFHIEKRLDDVEEAMLREGIDA